MRLDKLEIKGFKSFKDKTILEFPDNFTVIVGPNGSGKSNIVDSICFVLGRSRGLRANSLTELICDGGLNGEKLNSAKVTLHLSDNGSKFKVSRIIDRNGNSTYLMDNKRTTRAKIIELLGDNEYNIILQGDVTKIIDMKPKERRQIIDDLCGIREYDKKKEKALKELEKVEKRISDTHIILGEREGYKEQLKQERNDALRYQKLQNDLTRSRASILYKTINSYRNRLNNVEEKINSLEEERKKLQSKQDEIKEKINEKNNELEKINSEIRELEKEKGVMQIPELRGEVKRVQDRITSLNENLKDIGQSISEMKKRRDKAKREISEIDERLAKLNKKLKESSEKIAVASKRIEGIEIESTIDTIKSKIFDLQSRIRAIQDSNERNELEINRLVNEKSGIEKRIKEMKAEEKNLERQIRERSKRHEKEFLKYNKLRAELPKLEKRKAEIEKLLNSLRIEFAQKKTELETVERTSGGLNVAVKSLMKLKKIIPGIHGPVFQLGKVSKKEYEKSLQIAAGGRMNFMVVEDEDVASKCIEYLRKKRIGRCTFLPLNKINVKLVNKAPSGSIGFARDFIEYDKKFRDIFNYVFGNTILVKDISSAKKLGIRKWRMITLNGDLIETSGAMTGGYTRRMEINFSRTDELEKEIKNIEKRIIELDGQRQELELKGKKINQRLLSLEKPVNSGRTDIEKIEIEKNTLIAKRNELENRVREIGDTIKNLKGIMSESIRQIKEIEKELKREQRELDKLIQKKSEINLKFLEKLKDKHRDLEVEEKCLEEKKTLFETQINELTEDIKKLTKKKSNIENQIKEAEGMYSRMQNELANLEKENTELMEKIGSMMANREKIENEIKELGIGAGSISYTFDRIDNDLNSKMVEKAKFETKLTDLEEEFKEFEGAEILEESMTKLNDTISRIESELETLGSVNMKAIENYDKLTSEINEIEEKLETLKEERQSIFDFMEKVESKKREVFMKTFDVIKDNFEKMYKELTGGKGTLTLDNPREISESGLLITASPKGKKLINIDAMSGGEKVVTSSAFLLAIQQYKPSYFYVLDEIDAALDDRNSQKLAEILKGSDTQFIMITHNDYITKSADSIIGVSMDKGISQIVGVKIAQ